MSILTKEKGLLQKGGQVNGTTIIAADTVCTGNLESGNDLRIDGTIHGDVICKSKVVVGNGGQIFGNIHCAQADIVGQVQGNVAASESLSLRKGAKLVGDINTPMLQMENGVLFDGHCRMGSIPEAHSNNGRTKHAKETLAENVN